MKEAFRPPFIFLIAMAGAFLTGPFGGAHSLAAVEVEPLPAAIAPFIDIAGRAFADKANERLANANDRFRTEVGKYTEGELFGITGKLSPSAEIGFVRAGLCMCDGRNGAVMEFFVHARTKLDIGSQKLLGLKVTREIWGVDTRQLVQIVILPKRRADGAMAAEVSAEVVSATAKKERGARQRQADAFRDAVRLVIEATLARYTGEHDLPGVLGKLIPTTNPQAAN